MSNAFSNKNFVHFHVHSSFSHFDGLAKLEDLVMTARKKEFPAIALTDHGNVMGWINFLKYARQEKDKKGNSIEYKPIKPILGQEFYISRQMDIGQNDIKDKDKVPKSLQPEGRKGNYHLNLYAMNYEGYKNVCTLSQEAWLKGFYHDPRIDLDILDKHSEGVMGGSACLKGLINRHLLFDKYEKAKKVAGCFNEILNGNFFLEVMYHGIRAEKLIIPDIFKLSSETGIPVLCTNDSHYIKKGQAKSQEVLMAMSTASCLSDPNHIKYDHDEFYLKDASEMEEIFGSSPQCLFNTMEMADRIDTNDIERHLFGGMRLPKFKIPKKYNDSYDYMEKLAWDGLKEIGWSNSPEHIDALKMELRDVKVAKENNNYDFAKYFLIVKDYIDEASDRGVLIGCGRGSGYASVLLRCLGITYGVDPLSKGLLWNRFLGFDDLRFIKDSDFGFEDIGINLNYEQDDLEEDRELEDDLGGVDRY